MYPAITEPEAVRNLNITEVTTSSVVLSWTDSVGQSSFYRVQWTNGTSTWDKNVSEAKINISELSAGVQYHFTVTAVAGDDKTESDASKVSLYTKPEAVRNLSITKVTTSSVFLSWTDSGGVSSFYRVQWTNGTSTWDENVTESKINISELSAGVQYHFTVIAVAGDNKTESDVSKVYQHTKPFTVRNVSVTDITTSSMFLSWIEPDGMSQSYKILWSNGILTDTLTVNQTHVNISNLISGVQYNITVSAVAGDGFTEGQTTTITRYTKPEVVKNLTITEIATSSLSLTWIEPEGQRSFFKIHCIGRDKSQTLNVTETNVNISGLTPGIQYNISVTAVANDGLTKGQSITISQYTKPAKIREPTRSTNTSSITLNWTLPFGDAVAYKVQVYGGPSPKTETETNEKSAVLRDLIPGTNYTITITALAGDNSRGEPCTFTAVTQPDTPTDIRVLAQGTDNLSITWILPQGKFDRFRVNISNDDINYSDSTVATTNITLLTGLQPGRLFVVTVSAELENFISTSVQVSFATIPLPPDSINIHERTNSSLTLNWTSAAMDGAPNISYSVTYQSENSTVKTSVTSGNNITLDQLSSGTSYIITVETVGPQNLRSMAVHKSAFTLPNPVVALRASPKSTTSVEVNWSYPHGSQTYYRYFVKISNSGGTTINKTLSVNSTEVEELEPGTQYNISVKTVAAEGIESTAEETISFTMPDAVNNLIVKDVNLTSVQLTWSRPNAYKPSYSYLVIALQNNMTVQNTYTATENHTFDDLNPGQLYTFQVFTVVEEVNSTMETVSTYTRPEAVSNLRAVGDTTDLLVSWIHVTDQVESFTVLLYNSTKSPQHLEKNETGLSNTRDSQQFFNLTPGVLYIVEVVSKSGPFENNSSISNATFPNPPGPIMVVSQTVKSINFSWSHPEAMVPGQYNFSVTTFRGSVLVKDNWFLLDDVDSGSPYKISVVTVGVLQYESTRVTAENYTRPHPVSNLKKAGITPEELTLVWEQTESKPNYSYVVEASDGTNSLSYETKQITLTIPGLLSGSCYDFSVTTQTADGTQAPTAVTVSYCTPPFNVTQLKAETINTTTIRLDWQKPLQHKPEYRYRVETRGCTSTNKTFEAEVATLSGLPPGTECTFCVFVTVNNVEGKNVCVSRYTKPEAVQPSVSSQGSNSSVLVTWTPPSGRVEKYKVYLNDTSTAELNENQTSYLFEGLSAGRLYSATVTTLSGPFNASSKPVTNATFPNPPGPIEILEKTTSSIKIRWEEAALMDDTSFQYRLTIMPSQGVTFFNPNINEHTFDSLLSGTSYNISILTVGVQNFQSEEVQYPMVTTRPFGVKNLHTSAEEKEITVEWDQPDEYKESYRYRLFGPSPYFMSSGNLTNNSFKVVDGLVPGTQYNFSVTTETSDGTRSDPRWISSCTNASKVINLTCQAPNESSAKLILSWKRPDGNHSGFRFTVNGTNTINSSTCCNQTVTDLSHHTEYDLTVETLSCGAPSIPVLKSCITGITDPPISPDSVKLVSTQDLLHDSFNIHIEPEMLNNINGPITHVGVLITEEDPADSSDWKTYLGKTYSQWKDKETPVYLATVIETSSTSRSVESSLIVKIGDRTQWHNYNNGPLDPNGKYQCSIVLFTSLSLTDNVVDSSTSLVSATAFIVRIVLPQNPATVIGIAVGATLGIFCFLFIILIGFIIYWKRLSNKETSDIQIHSMRAKVSVAVRVEDYEAYYRKQKADSNCGFAEEFEDLKLVGTGQSKSNALMLENKPKNRYNNVLPYDSSRVKLSIIHGSPHDDYINANYMPGYNSRKEFIAAQGPLPATVSEFWRMIWEKNVQTLVMLTRCNEQGRVKCEQYWDLGTKHFDNITVTTVSEIPLEDWTIRDFDIKNVKTAETRSVRHFHFTAWPDHGVPETTELLISFRHLVREHMDQYSRHSPTVVHCSAGVGRTGTFICIDRLIAQIERENIVDVYGVVHDLRMHRPLMVQTEDQYVFLNQCAMDIIRSRTGTNVDLIYQNTAALSIYENVEPKKGYPKNGYHNA